ncbi:UPF0102 protein [Spirochaetia bacterium]|nr:UPF0102 protein [Spirochaetia bacterium]
MKDISKYSRGQAGENSAAVFLLNSGFDIIGRNYRSPVGEIDIIAVQKNGDQSDNNREAEKNDILVFIEVKAWSTFSMENLQYGINKKKCKKIVETAKYFLQKHRKYIESSIRFDVVFIDTTKITHIKSAFTENICQE